MGVGWDVVSANGRFITLVRPGVGVSIGVRVSVVGVDDVVVLLLVLLLLLLL